MKNPEEKRRFGWHTSSSTGVPGKTPAGVEVFSVCTPVTAVVAVGRIDAHIF